MLKRLTNYANRIAVMARILISLDKHNVIHSQHRTHTLNHTPFTVHVNQIRNLQVNPERLPCAFLTHKARCSTAVEIRVTPSFNYAARLTCKDKWFAIDVTKSKSGLFQHPRVLIRLVRATSYESQMWIVEHSN